MVRYPPCRLRTRIRELRITLDLGLVLSGQSPIYTRWPPRLPLSLDHATPRYQATLRPFSVYSVTFSSSFSSFFSSLSFLLLFVTSS